MELRTTQSRQDDDAVGLDRAVGGEPEDAAHELDRARATAERDRTFLEQPTHLGAALETERFQRRGLRRGQRELDACDPVRRRVRRRQQRQLVERQRPHGTVGNGERHPPHHARLDLVEQPRRSSRGRPALGR